MSEDTQNESRRREEEALLTRFPQLSEEERRRAMEQLVHSPSHELRDQVLRLGAALLTDAELVSCLREEADASVRNAGLEMLKLRGLRSFSLAVALLHDDDPDVVLQAVLVLDHLKDPRALEPLRSALHHPDVNVVQAAILAMGHLGDGRVVSELLPFLSGDPWLQAASVEALGDLRSPRATPALRPLLNDLFVGALVTEALARIGGDEAFAALAEHWLRFEQDLEEETHLGLLAHVLEGLGRAPSEHPELRANLRRRLEDPVAGVRLAAARGLLAMGPGDEDSEALAILEEGGTDLTQLPYCLRRRHDLIPELLERGGGLRIAGFLLAAREPDAAPPGVLTRALKEGISARNVPAVVELLRTADHPELDEALLDLVLDLPREARFALKEALITRSERLRPLLNHRDVPRALELVLAAWLGGDGRKVAAGIEELSRDEQVEALRQVADRRDVLALLPWEKWLAEDPAHYAPVAAAAATQAEMRELLSTLRPLLTSHPGPELIRAAGALGDRESIPALLDLLESRPNLAPLILESLGEIGGVKARRRLAELTRVDDPALVRIAYHALALSATEEEEALFTAAVEHPDWNVRLAAADVLGRSSRAEHLPRLARLAADPVAIVARRARSFLEP